ncbi:MAG: hypothetical protein MUP14_00085 [Dehalococcoidia bacterium]|nr:hypothetical protein [Dehalococcoidia bacterium]
MKKLLVLGVVVVALVGAGLIAYAAYVVDGTSSPENFTAGEATNLVPDPASEDLAGILPGQTREVRVSVYNPNPVGVTVTGVDLTFSYQTECALTTTPWGPGSYGLAANASSGYVFGVSVTMGGAAAAGCEGAPLEVTATAKGTLP